MFIPFKIKNIHTRHSFKYIHTSFIQSPQSFIFVVQRAVVPSILACITFTVVVIY